MKSSAGRFDVVTKTRKHRHPLIRRQFTKIYCWSRPNPKSTGAAYRQPDLGRGRRRRRLYPPRDPKPSDTGCAVLVISEDLDEMFFLCDEIAVINKGRLGAVHPIASIGIEDVGRQWLSAAQFNTANAVFSFCPSAD